MKTYSKAQILRKIDETNILMLIQEQNYINTIKVLKCIYDAGVYNAAIYPTNNIESYKELRTYARNHLPNMYLGVAGIFDKITAEQYLMADVDFLITPIVNKEIADSCREHDKIFISAGYTLTEIANAHTLGADMIYIYPTEGLSPKYCKTILESIPVNKLLGYVTYHTDRASMKSWLNGGAKALIIDAKHVFAEISEAHLEHAKSEINKMLAELK
jgi:2-dehydro-3-deoxyphosphogluconate aldolase/(4S)-4-hydroxy-2-oxoglutarate aldolase